MQKEQRLSYSLFLLRIGVFVVMLVWTLDKFLRPEHGATVFAHYYALPVEHWMMLVIAAAEMLIILAFLIGFLKRLSYLLVLIFHAISTFSSFPQYLNPFHGPNLLFFAAWPMLAACIALYLLRDSDTFLTVS